MARDRATDEALTKAVAHHKAGRLEEAERLYREILASHPDHPDANHNLGVLISGLNRPMDALPYFKVALDSSPEQGQFWVSYIDALIRSGQQEMARQVLEQGRKIGLRGDAVERLGQALGQSGRSPDNGIPEEAEVNAMVELFNNGQHSIVRELALKMTSNFPDYAFGWKVLGSALMCMGDLIESWGYLQRAVELMPEDAEIHSNLGNLFFDLGRLEEGQASCRQAIVLNPEFAEAYNNLGNILCDLGRLDEAEVSCRQAIALKPTLAEAYNNLGKVLRNLGKLEDAESSFRKAIALKPGLAEAYNNLGNVLGNLERVVEAEASYLQAIALKPGLAQAYNNLGNVLCKLGRAEEAEGAYQNAIKIKPHYAEAFGNLGNLFFDLGRPREAESCYRHAMASDPRNAEYWRYLSNIKKFTGRDADIQQMMSLYNDPHASEENRAHICFALGKAMEDIGEYDESFRFYAEGNGLRKAQLSYAIGQDLALFNRIRSAFETLQVLEPVLFEGAKPILIVGMPRSATSLVEQILASHSEVHGGGELELLTVLAEKHFMGVPADGSAWDIASGYFEEIGRMAKDFQYVTDKMPLNFRWLGFLLLANPDLKVVHTIRDPMATCWSNYRQYFPAQGLGFACDLRDVAEYYKLYQDLMAFWHQKFPGRIYDLDYERLTEDQEGETRKLLEYCGLSWEDACLNFHQTKRAVRTASAAQVRKKLYGGSSEAWKKFEQHLGPLKIILE